MYDFEEPYYEPSLVDEILSEYSSKMQKALLDSVKQKMNSIIEENNELKNENDKLKLEINKVRALENNLKCEKQNLLRTVRNERLSELMKYFNILMYKAYNKGKLLPKCNKCNNDRMILFHSPSGKEMKEPCSCGANIQFYVPKVYHCSEFKIKNHNKTELSVWYKEHKDNQLEDDWYSYDSDSFAEIIYDKSMTYEYVERNIYKIFFRYIEECQAFCDWMNNKEAKSGD